MTGNGDERISRPAELTALSELKGFILARATAAGFSPGQCDRIELAVDELLTNVISHGYPRGSGVLTIGCRATPASLRVSIVDRGAPFNPLTAAAPDLHADLDHRRIGGLGIFLARRMADRLSYRRYRQCNILTLCFHKEAG